MEYKKMENIEIHSITWSVNFEILVNGDTEVKFWELTEADQEYILECIKNDTYSGMN